MNHQKIKLILFDLDGTLIDNREFLGLSSFNILEQYFPGDYTLEKIQKNFGNGFKELLPNTNKDKNNQALIDFYNVKKEKYTTSLLFPGVIEGLNKLKENNFTLGIVTNQNKKLAVNYIEENNMFDLFDHIVGREDVMEGKPSPEGIINSMAVLGYKKHETLMIGDSFADMIAGSKAEVSTGFIKSYTDLQIPEGSNPDLILGGFNELLKKILL